MLFQDVLHADITVEHPEITKPCGTYLYEHGMLILMNVVVVLSMKTLTLQGNCPESKLSATVAISSLLS